MDVVHNPQACRFETLVDGHLCRLDYRVADYDREVTFTYTFVAPQRRGRGVAAALVSAGLDWARAECLQVVPACSYVRTYMQRHPDTLDLLADEHP